MIDERESHHQPSSKRFRKHISEHDIKSIEFEEDYFGPNTHEQKYGPPKKLRHLMSLAKEPRRFYDHIGTNEEGNIYTNLLNIKLDNFTVPNKPTNTKKETQNNFILNDYEFSKKILSFLNERLSSCNFEDLIKVMLKLIDENRYSNDLLNKIHDIIIDRIMSDNGSCFKLVLNYESKNINYIRSICEKYLKIV